MAKQINQYTKTRTAATTKDDDYLDFDSTEDNGSTFESAKITVLQFVTYLITKIPTFFSSDGAIAETRNVEMNGFDAEFENGNIINKAALADVGYKLQDSLGNEKGSLGYDVSLDTATLELKDATSSYLVATDGGVGIGTVPTSARLTVRGDTVGAEATLIVSNQIGTQAMLIRNDSSVFIGNALFRHPSYDATLAMGSTSTEANKIRLDDDAGGSAFVVRKGGTVGVGIAIPTARLHVVHPAGLSGPLTLQVVGTAAVKSLSVLNDGNVGMGTDIPSAKLHVEGSVRLNTTIASVIGEVWTATDAIGNGAWTAAGGDGNGIYTGDGALSGNTNADLSGFNFNFTNTGATTSTINSAANIVVDRGLGTTHFEVKRSGSSRFKAGVDSGYGYSNIYSNTGTLNYQVRANRQTFYDLNGGTQIWEQQFLSAAAFTIQDKTNSNTFNFKNDGSFGIGILATTARFHILGAGATSATTNFLAENSAGTDLFQILDNGNIGISGAATSTSSLNISNLPVASAGLVAGDVWNNAGVLTIV